MVEGGLMMVARVRRDADEGRSREDLHPRHCGSPQSQLQVVVVVGLLMLLLAIVGEAVGVEAEAVWWLIGMPPPAEPM